MSRLPCRRPSGAKAIIDAYCIVLDVTHGYAEALIDRTGQTGQNVLTLGVGHIDAHQIYGRCGMKTFVGKIAVVTGGGSGIGFAVAERFANEGAEVVLVGRGKERLDEAARLIGHGAYGVVADVGDDEQVKAVFDALPRVDLLATCAGGAVFGDVGELPVAEWRQLFDGRFFGQLSACHYAVPKMPEGSLILLCSGVAGEVGLPGYSGGSALCGAVNAMGRALAVELAERGIRVNVLAPGHIDDTAIGSNLGPEEALEFRKDMLARIPMHRAGKSVDLAEAAHFLATCEYANGIVLDVDGGWTAS